MKAFTIAGLIAINLSAIVLSYIGFEWSANSSNWRGFFTGQVVGNLAGFVGVLALTFLLRFIPLHFATAISMGVGFVLVQVIAAHLVFHETVSTGHWLGVALIAGGILLISFSRAHGS